MSQSLQSKVAFITGAANGIGAGVARALVDRGARVVLADVDRAALDAVAAELGEDHALAVHADVCELDSMQRAVDAGVSRFGGIDYVLANAGIASYGSLMAVDPAIFKRVLEVNLLGIFHTVRAALPRLIERRGYVLVVSSEAAFAPAPGMISYDASKAGAEHFASALRTEVAHLGVDVGSAHMSWIDTPLVRDAKNDLPSFRQMLSVLPPPLGKTTSVDKCVHAFVAGLEGRKRRVFVPGWVRLLAWFKPLITSPLGERETLKHAPTLVAQMDQEVAALGRSTSARNVSAPEPAGVAK